MTAPPPLVARLTGRPEPDDALDAFTGWVAAPPPDGAGLTPYPAQEEALLELAAGSHVVLSTPTGSGKSLVATGAHAVALAAGRRSVYTAPIKALVSEKFFALVDVFGPENVGMATGDAAVNPDAPIVCCTAEVLANKALREGAGSDVAVAVLDEFHYYADPDRGWAWQVPLLEMTGTQFLLMSATLGDVGWLRDDLQQRTGRETALVTSVERPVPLRFEYAMTPVHETLAELLATHQAPVYVVHPTQAGAVEQAQALMSVNVCTREEKDAIAAAIGDVRFTAGFGRTLSRLVRHGIGVHHAGMLPRYRRLVESLTQQGLLKVVCGTDTLGVGINVPIRTVLLTSLTKFDGNVTRHLKAREFHQLAGRAGRAGFDVAGTVVAQAPEHDIANAKALAKIGDDPKKRRSYSRKKPPEGSVSWSEQTFERLIAAEPERLTSQFRVTSSMLLQLMARPGDPFEHAKRLLLGNHDDRAAKRRHVRRAIALFRALEASGVVERLPEPEPDGRRARLTVDLRPDFALDQPLSPFALAALELLDRASPTYALDVLSVLEATLDDPRQVLRAQQHKARGEAVAEMKADGVEYEERMELLEDVSWPKPLEELLTAAFETYAKGHPWVRDFELSPKSVARDLAERSMTFVEYVGFYGLARSEGLVLRYLADAYKALRRTVPVDARTEEVEDLVAWLGEPVRQVDSSLLDEWEALRTGAVVPAAPPVEQAPPPVTANERAFRVLVRNAMWRRVELVARRHWTVLGELDPDVGEPAWREAVEAYFAEHDEVGTGPDARGPHLFVVEADAGGQGAARTWHVRQVLDDPAGHHDWAVTADVDLDASDEAGEAVVRVHGLSRLD
ncbi:MAG: DEAD/DEAH box helicase [Actinomycetes bacterium]